MTSEKIVNLQFHKVDLLDRAVMLDMRAMLAAMPSIDLTPGGRASFDDLVKKTPVADDVTYKDGTIAGVHGVWCRVTNAEPGAAILYLHGGGYVVGSARAYRHFAGQIAARTGADTFVAEYGLAPEHPFPTAVDDAEAVYVGLANAGFSRIAVVGDSAGGGLALVVTARMTAAASDGALRPPSGAAVISPWTDLSLVGASMEEKSQLDPLLTRAALEGARRQYLGTTDARDPRASPLFGELKDFPPVMLHVGEDEILLDDARRYADLLTKAGGSVELHVWQGMVHVFPANLAVLHAADGALDILANFLRRNLGVIRTSGAAL